MLGIGRYVFKILNLRNQFTGRARSLSEDEFPFKSNFLWTIFQFECDELRKYSLWLWLEGKSIAANPPGFPGNLPDFDICSGIQDLKKKSRILKFVPKKREKKGIIS